MERAFRESGEDLSGAVRDPHVLLSYLENVYKRLSDYEMFGIDDKNLYNLAEKLEPADAVRAKRILDRILKKEAISGDVKKVSAGIRSFETITKLTPLSSLKNLTQNISTAVYTNPVSTGKAILRKIFNGDAALDDTMRAGELLSNSWKQYLADLTGSYGNNLTSKYLKAIGFEGTEKLNRIVAVNAGMFHSDTLFKRLLKENAFLEDSSVFKRGGLPFDKKKVTDRGISLAKDRADAEAFVTGVKNPLKYQGGELLRGRGGVIEDIYLSTNAKILEVSKKSSEIPEDILKKYLVEDQLIGRELISGWAGKNGYDAVNFAGDIEVRVLNPNVIESLPEGSLFKDTPTARALQELGLDPDTLLKEGLTMKDKISAGRHVSEVTQFSTNPEDLPYFWSSDGGKVLTQFKSFSFKQAKFTKEQLTRGIRELSKGNPKVLINTLLAAGIGGTIAGEIIIPIKNLAEGKDLSREDEALIERIIRDMVMGYSIGAFEDVANMVSFKYGELGVYRNLGGPSVSDVVGVGKDISSALKEDGSFEPLLKRGISNIPAVGRFVSKRIFDNKKLRSNIKGQGSLEGTGKYFK